MQSSQILPGLHDTFLNKQSNIPLICTQCELCFDEPLLVIPEPRQAKRGCGAGKSTQKQHEGQQGKSRSQSKPAKQTAKWQEPSFAIHNPSHQWQDYLSLVKENILCFVEVDPRTWICQNFNTTDASGPVRQPTETLTND
jgi:hypothetical protein